MCNVLSRYSQNSFKDLSEFFQSSLSSFTVLSKWSQCSCKALSKFSQRCKERGNIKIDEKMPKYKICKNKSKKCNKELKNAKIARNFFKKLQKIQLCQK